MLYFFTLFSKLYSLYPNIYYRAKMVLVLVSGNLDINVKRRDFVGYVLRGKDIQNDFQKPAFGHFRVHRLVFRHSVNLAPAVFGINRLAGVPSAGAVPVRDSADKARRVFQIGTKQARGTAVDLRGKKLCVLVDSRRTFENKNPILLCLRNIRLVRVHTEQGKIGCGASRQALSVFCKDILENMIIQSEVRY